MICEIEAFCDHCEECYKTIACNKLNVVVHCPGPCGGNVPMSTKNVNMERSTFGYKSLNQYPDFPLLSKLDFTQFVDSIIDSTNPYISPIQRELIHTGELSKLYPFDVVKLTSEGNIESYANLTNLSTNQTFRFDKIAFELAHTPIGNKALFALKEATLTFIDSINNTSFTAALSLRNVNPSNTEVFGMSGDTLYSFELIIDSLANFPQLLDTINPFSYRLQLNAEFWTLPDVSNPINPIIVRGQFVCSTNVNEQITQYSCDPWGAQLRVLVPQNDLSIHILPDSTSYCKTKAKISVTLDGGFGSNIDDFEYEFRPLVAYTDTAFSTQFVDGYGIQTPSDTVFFNSDTLVNLWNSTVDMPFLRAIEKPDSQFISLTSLRYCASGGDTIHYNLPIYDYAYITNQHAIDSLFVPLHLATPNPISLNDYAFFHPQDSLPLSQTEIQSVDEPLWIYPSLNPLANLFIGIPSASQIQGISNADTLEFNLHLKAPDSLNMGNCWLSYSFSKSINNAPPISVTTAEYSDSLDFLTDSLVLDTLGAYFHFFPNGFPLDSLSTILKMPVACDVNQYRLKLKYGCFCDSTEYLFFKQHPDSIPSCIADSNWVNFERNNPQVNLYSNLIVSNDSSGCALVWNVQVENLQHSPNLTNGQLLINIPTGLVLNTSESTFQYFEPLDSLAASSGNYTLGDTLLPPDDYTFQFEDFPTPPTTVLVLAFPSVDTLLSGGRLAFNLKFKLDQSTCNLDSSYFQNNFLYRVLEARFTGQPICADSLFKSDYILQDFLNDSIPSLQTQITDMTSSADCCLPSAVTVSLQQACSDSTNGTITFHFSSDSTSNQIQLYKIDDLTNADSLVFDIFSPDSLYSTNQPAGLYSAIVTTSGGLVYVFNGLQIQNHGVLGNIHVIQDSPCSGSLVQLTALDSNAINQFPYNDSNPFVATSPTTYPALEYYWINSDVTVDTLNNSLASANPLNDTTYSVVISHSSGCRDTVSVQIDILEMPSVSILQLPNNICNLNTFELSAQPSGGTYFVNSVELTTTVLDPAAFEEDTLEIIYKIENDSGCVKTDTIYTIQSNNSCNCAPCNQQNTPLLIIPDSISTSSQLTTIIGTNVIQNRCIVFNHDFTVNNSFSFINCELTISGGKRIKNSNFLLIDSCFLKGCEQMWFGIENIGKLKLLNSTLRDAHFGILLQRNGVSFTYVDNTTFENNFVGIKSDDDFGDHPLEMKGVNFIGGNLLQTYPNQTPLPLGYSLAGIVAVNGYNLIIPSVIQFKNLCNGILLYKKAYANVFESRFENIQPFGVNYQGSTYWLDNQITAWNSANPFNNVSGNGIYAGANSYVFVGGFSQLNPNNWGNSAFFDNCNKGVYVKESDAYVRNCNFNNVNIGVRGLNLRGKMFKIFKNRIASRVQGISLMQSDFMVNDTIGFNLITSLPTFPQFSQIPIFNTLSFNKGIFVSNQQLGRFTTIIGNNISAPFGIEINSATGIKIESDTVSILPFNFFNANWDIGAGIYVTNSPKSLIACNIVNGNTTNKQSGIQLINSRSSLIKNNQIDNSRFGFRFFGNCQTDSFKLNTIQNHQIGLDITATGILGSQINNGNRWVGNYNITPARRQSTNIFGGSLSSFTIHDPSNLNFYPLLPVPFQPFIGFCTGDFFFCDFSYNAPPNPYCSVIEAPLWIVNEDNGEGEKAKLARLLAKDSLAFDPFTAPVKFAISKDIYEAISAQELILPDTGVFLDLKDKYNASIEKLYSEFEKAQGLNALSENTQQIRKTYHEEIDLIFDQIKQIDSIIVAENLYDDIEIRNQRTSLSNEINQKKMQLELIDNNILEKQEITKDSAFVYSNGIITSDEYKDFERRINNIYLNTIAQNNFDFKEEQIAELAYVAHLCPALGGTAVFKARSLYALLNDTVLYNDEAACLEQGVMYRLSQSVSPGTSITNSQQLNIYPNPTQGRFLIKSSSSEPIEFRISIFNSLGQLIHAEINTISGEQPFSSLESAAQGIYLVLLHNLNGDLMMSEKLVKN